MDIFTNIEKNPFFSMSAARKHPKFRGVFQEKQALWQADSGPLCKQTKKRADFLSFLNIL